MKKLKKPSIDKYGLCLNEYTNNKNNAEVYFKRAVGLYPEMETSKAIANILKKKDTNNETQKIVKRLEQVGYKILKNDNLNITFEYSL